VRRRPGAIAARRHGAAHPERIEILLECIHPGLVNVDLDRPLQEVLDAAVEANVRWAMTGARDA
jgi:hypothetical protein